MQELVNEAASPRTDAERLLRGIVYTEGKDLCRFCHLAGSQRHTRQFDYRTNIILKVNQFSSTLVQVGD